MKPQFLLLLLLLCISGCSGEKASKSHLEINVTFRGEDKISMGGSFAFSELIDSDEHPDMINGVVFRPNDNEFLYLHTERGPKGKEYDLQLIYAYYLPDTEGIIVNFINENPEYSFEINGEERSTIHIESTSNCGYLNVFVLKIQK